MQAWHHHHHHHSFSFWVHPSDLWLPSRWKWCLEAEVGFSVCWWQHGGDVLCGKTGPRLPAVALAFSRAAAGAGRGESNLRYVWRQQRQHNYLLRIFSIPHSHFSHLCFCIPCSESLFSELLTGITVLVYICGCHGEIYCLCIVLLTNVSPPPPHVSHSVSGSDVWVALFICSQRSGGGRLFRGWWQWLCTMVIALRAVPASMRVSVGLWC